MELEKYTVYSEMNLYFSNNAVRLYKSSSAQAQLVCITIAIHSLGKLHPT